MTADRNVVAEDGYQERDDCAEAVAAARAEEKTKMRDAGAAYLVATENEAASELAALRAAASRVLRVAQPNGADDDGFVTGYTFKTGALHALAAVLPGQLLLVPERDTNAIEESRAEVAALWARIEALANDWERGYPDEAAALRIALKATS